jgi:hypothetical protein
MGHAARLVALVALSGTAHADELVVRTALELGLHTPRSLAVDIFGAINDRLTLGLSTSHDSLHELGVGRGLCLSRCGDRLPDVLPADDPYRYAGLAAQARIRFAPDAIGIFAIDATRFAPTPAALHLGLDLSRSAGPWGFYADSQIRVGITRRDLDDNRDAGSLELELDRISWFHGGVSLVARGEVELQALRSTPSLGAAVGAWQVIGPAMLSLRLGDFEFARASAGSSLYAEIAVAWRR